MLFKPLHLLGMLHACFGFEGIKDFISSIKRLTELGRDVTRIKRPSFADFFFCLIKCVENVFILLVENMPNKLVLPN